MEIHQSDAAMTPSPRLRPLGHTVFFGLVPPSGVAAEAHRQARGLINAGKASGSVRPACILHVSLLAYCKRAAEAPPQDIIEWLGECAARVRRRPFLVSFDRVQSWSGGQVVALSDDGVIGVETLFEDLMDAFGVKAPTSPKPHMTLLYGTGPAACVPIEPTTWTVREFALIHSFVGQTRYEILRRFPLAA